MSLRVQITMAKPVIVIYIGPWIVNPRNMFNFCLKTGERNPE